MKSSTSLSFLGLLTLCLLMSPSIMAATWYTWTNGDPNTLANWWANNNGTGAHPANFTTAGDIFIIQNNNTMTTTVNWMVTGSVVINNNCTLTVNSAGTTLTVGALTINGGGILTTTRVIIVNGATNITGTVNFQTTARADQFNGDVTLNSGAVWNETVAITPTFAGNFTNNATTFTANTGVHTFSGTGMTISGSTTTSIASVTVSGTYSNSATLTVATALTVNGTITNNDTITATTALSGTGGMTNGATGVLIIGGTSGITTLTATATGSTVNYNGAAQTVFNTNYYNLMLSGSGIKTLQTGTTAIGGNLTLSGTATVTTVAGLTITGNLVIGNGTSFTAAGYALSVTGTTTVGGGTSGTLAISSATGTKTFTGDVTISAGATWNETAAAVVNYGGNFTNNAGTLTASTGVHTFSGTTKTIGGSTTTSIANITISGTYTNNGTLTVGTALAGTGGLTNNGTLNIGGTSGITALTATANGNTVNYTGAVQTIFSTNYFNLTLSGSGTVVLQTGTAAIGGNLTLSGTVSTTTAAGLTITGNLVTGNGTSFTAAGFPLAVNGTTTVGGGTSGTLTVSSATGNKRFLGGITINAGANFTENAAATLVFGSVTINGTLTENTTAVDTISGNFTNNGTFTPASSTVIFNGNTTIAGTATTTTFYNVTLTGTASVTTGVAFTINGVLVIGDGTTFTAAGYALGVVGTTTVGGGMSGALNVSSATGYKRFMGGITFNSNAIFTESAAATAYFGGVTINNGATMTENGATVDTISGNFMNIGTYTAGTGNHVFMGAGYVFNGSSITSIPTVIMTGTYTNNGTLTVGTALSGTGTLTQGSNATLNIGGTSGITTLAATAAGNTINYNGTGQTVKAINYWHLTFSGTGTFTLTGVTTISGWLILSGTVSVTTGAALSIGGNLVIGDGTTFTAGAYTLSVTGTTTIGGGTSGTFAISSATGAKTFSGDVIINAGATWNETAAAAVNDGGNFTNNAGTFTTSTGVHTFSGTGMTISGSTTTSIPTATFTGAYTNTGTFTVSTLLTVTGVTLTNNGTITATASLAGTGGTLLQGASSTLNIGGTSTIATLTAIATGNTVNYTGAAQTVFGTNYYNLSLSGSGTKTLTTSTTAINGYFMLSGTVTVTGIVGIAFAGDVNLGTGTTFNGSTFTYTVNGNWYSNGGRFNANTSTVNYAGSYSGQIVGGGFAYYNLQISNGGTKILQGGNDTVTNILTLNSGVFTLNDNNLILNLNTTAAIAGAPCSATNMIETNGAGYVQKQGAAWNNGAGIGFNIVFPIGSGGFYNPLDLTNGFTATAGTGILQIRAVSADTGTNSLSKFWVLTISAAYTGITTKLQFTYDSTAEVHGNRSQYDVLFYNGTNWVQASQGTRSPLGVDPFWINVSSVTGTSLSGSWTAGTSAPNGGSSSTYYSYQSGDWADATSWTTDPSGATWKNPGIPAYSDLVTILNGRTITTNTNAKKCSTLTINAGGILDIKSTTGHTFGTISGQGKIMLSSTTLPSGTYTNFVASGGGTIEYYNLNNIAITSTSTPHTFNNLIISNYSVNANSVYFDNPSYVAGFDTINGNFSVKNYSSGSQTVYFGNPSPTIVAYDNLINMTVQGNFSVDANCNIRVNNFYSAHPIRNPNDEGTTADTLHTLTIYGNLTNNGSIRFTGLLSPVADAYYTLTTTANGTNYGDVKVVFKGATNNTVTCNGTTDFFRLVIDKGSDKTFILDVNSSSTNNFALYAPNNQGGSNFNNPVPPGIYGYGYGVYYKALFIRNGTLKLEQNINIPSLTEGGQDFNLIPTAELWINGANVSTTKSNLNGTGYQAATLYGTLRISSGQFSTGDAAGVVLGTSGTPIIMVEGSGTLDVSQAWASAGSNLMSIIQTGGTVNFRGQGEYHAGPMLGLDNPNASFSMSGGTMNFTNITTDLNIMNIQSQVGNYNVTGGTVNINLPSSANADTANSTVPFYNLNITNQTGTGTTMIVWRTPVSSLNVLNDLTINSNAVLNLYTNSIDLAVGHNFTIVAGGTYYDGATNTTTFNGSGAQTFDNSGTITGGALYNLVISNSSTTTIATNNLTVTNALSITQNATLNENGKYVYVAGNVTISGTVSGITTGGIRLNGTNPQTINGNGTGVFNNLIINRPSTSGITLGASVTVNGNLRLLSNPNFTIGSYNLALGANANIYTDMATGQNFDNAHMIITNGQLGDGGITKTFNSTNAFVYPFGTSSIYRPDTIQFTTPPSIYGSITIRPVTTAHLLNKDGSRALALYYKTTSTGFTMGGGILNQKYSYNSTDVPSGYSGDEVSYVPGVFIAPAWTALGSGQVNYSSAPRMFYFTGVSYIDGEYTAGRNSAFGSITTLYSAVTNGDWFQSSTWSATRGQGGGAGIPNSSTLVYIINNDSVFTSNNATSASITIEDGSVLDVKAYAGHNFGTVNNNGAGTGKLKIGSATFPQGDWSNFLGANGGTVEYYSSTAAYTLPTAYNLPVSGSNTITGYYNLICSPMNSYPITLPGTNLTIYKNFTASTATGATGNCLTQLNNATSTTIEVKGLVTVGSNAILQYYNAAGVPHNIIADSNITIASSGALQVNNNGNTVANTLTVYGTIINNGTFDLDPTAPTSDNVRCSLNFTGPNSVFFTSTSTPTRSSFYSITVNKGSSMSSVVNVNVNNTNFVMGGGGLTLQNGTFRLTTATNINISSGSITIPQSACLSANGGSFYIDTAVVGDVNLIGRLEILTGSVQIGHSVWVSSADINNIIYPSAITPEIIINSGSLSVYSQIRRATSNNAGALHYKQYGGTVTIGGNSPDTTRAALEVLNAGSDFEMTNGTLNIIKHIRQTYTSPYDLYLDPDYENITSNGTIQFGHSGTGWTPNNTMFTYLASGTIGNLALDALTNSSAIQEVYEATLKGNLTIGGASSYYNTNGLDITIAGNLINNNTSMASGLSVGGFQCQSSSQSTAFNGSANQTITGVGANLTNFANLDIATANGYTLSLASGTAKIAVNGDLTLSSGTFTDNGDTINVVGDVNSAAVHNSPSTTGGIFFIGPSNQGITGNGSGVFGNIVINNSGNGINMTDNTTINGQITFTNGYLYIDNYALTLGQSASITTTTSYSWTNEIQLNGISSDAGVTKIFPSGNNISFAFQFGVNSKSVPCIFKFTSNPNAAGRITVIPVDNVHPSITVTPTTNYLDFYWNVTASGFSSAYSVTDTFYYNSADVVNNPTHIECDSSNIHWVTLTGTITGSSPYKFYFGPINYLNGAYSIGDQFTDLPILYSWSSGNWFTSGTWSTDTITYTNIKNVYPNGHSVIIRSPHTISLQSNNALASSVEIDGVLDAMNTTNHNIGIVKGSGIIMLKSTVSGMFTFPAGTYDTLLSNSNSMVVFYGTANGTMPLSPGNVNTPYQNVLFTGTGTKYVSSVDIKVSGNLIIGAGCKLDNSLYNKDVFLLGNWVDSNTTTAGFTAGTGTVRFVGASKDSIKLGNSSMTETFYNLEINNSSGLIFKTGSVSLSNQLLLTSGYITTSSSNSLTITNTGSSAVVGGSSNSFINGPLKKYIPNGSSFQFPVGDTVSSNRHRIGYVSVTSLTTGTQTWTAQFYDKNPTTNIGAGLTGLASVVNNEYWSVSVASSANANITLTWDQYSGQSNDASIRVCTRVAEWIPSYWNNVGALVTDNGQYSGTVATSTGASLDNNQYYFTIGAVSPSNLFTSNSGTGNWNVAATWNLARVPGQNDLVEIGSGSTVTLNTNTTIAQLIVDQGGTFNNGTGSNTLTLAGNLTLNGSWAGTSGKISMTIEPGTIYGSGSMTGTSTLEIAGSTNIDTAANLTLSNVSILSGKTLTNKGAVTINSLIGADATSTFTNQAGSTLTFNGSDLSTLTLTANQCTNTVIYNGSVSQTVKPTTYCNLTVSGTGAKAIGDGVSMTINGNVTQQSGTPFTVGTVVGSTTTMQITGALIVGTGFINYGNITVDDGN